MHALVERRGKRFMEKTENIDTHRSLNQDLQNPYLTMWIAAKESLDLPGDFHLRGRPYPQFCIEAYLVFSSQTEIIGELQKRCRKVLTK